MQQQALLYARNAVPFIYCQGHLRSAYSSVLTAMMGDFEGRAAGAPASVAPVDHRDSCHHRGADLGEWSFKCATGRGTRGMVVRHMREHCI